LNTSSSPSRFPTLIELYPPKKHRKCNRPVSYWTKSAGRVFNKTYNGNRYKHENAWEKNRNFNNTEERTILFSWNMSYIFVVMCTPAHILYMGMIFVFSMFG